MVESNETFTVSLTVSSTTALVTATDTGTGTITNDDTASTGIALSVDPGSVAEDGGREDHNGDGHAERRGPRERDAGHGESGRDRGHRHGGGRLCHCGNDLTMSIAAGNTADTVTFTLTPTDDAVVEGDETLSVSPAPPRRPGSR